MPHRTLTLTLMLAIPLISRADAGATVFEKSVRPLFLERCVQCHGEAKQDAGLRLDSAVALQKGSRNGPIIVPGKPDESKLVQVLRARHKNAMMPEMPIRNESIDAVVHWVQAGAVWPSATNARAPMGTHWAFQPIRIPAPPASRDALMPVDAFIAEKLQQRGLDFAPRADRRTLIRRLSFDLLGLPPSEAEIDAFITDPAPDAYERLVERLLASPHYGERWARHWLDISRYADTKGYVFFEEAEFRWAWTYRDYVIRAFNRDLPFDQFIREQLAADQLVQGEDRSALPALGFITIGGRFINNQHDIIDDRIDVVTRGLLGLTVSCARCHDHKFDPIPTADYYSLYGVFASSVEPLQPPMFQPAPKTAQYEAFAAELAKREKDLNDFIDAKQTALMTSARQRAGEYLLLAHTTRDQPRTDEFMLIADGNDLNPTMLRRWQVYLETASRKRHPVFIAWHRFAALTDAEFSAQAPRIAADVMGNGNALIAQAIAARPPQSMADVAKIYGEVLKSIDTKPIETLKTPAEHEVRAVLYGLDAPANLLANPINLLSLLPDRASQGELKKRIDAAQAWRFTGPGNVPRAHTLVDLPHPVESVVFRRGNPFQRGAEVPRQFLTALSGPDRQPFQRGSGRLELAEAIASPNNPLTARVIVNRIWAWHFGRGLVPTPSDFGLRSEPPSHPELLDYLAARFMSQRWSIKQLHREIVLSRTYQQSSMDRADGKAKDPENVLLWRMNRRRLDFESLRDALIVSSGRWDRTIGGPSASDLFGAHAGRRTLYGFLDRLNLPGLYRTFDFPHPDATSPQRDQTMVPPQALFLMNHPFPRDCARTMIHRPGLAPAHEPLARIDQLYRWCLGRNASPAEQQRAIGYLQTGGDWESLAHALYLSNEFAFVD